MRDRYNNTRDEEDIAQDDKENGGEKTCDEYDYLDERRFRLFEEKSETTLRQRGQIGDQGQQCPNQPAVSRDIAGANGLNSHR